MKAMKTDYQLWLEAREDQQVIKVEVGIDDLCDILDAADDGLEAWDSDLGKAMAARLRAVMTKLNRQIDRGGVK